MTPSDSALVCQCASDQNVSCQQFGVSLQHSVPSCLPRKETLYSCAMAGSKTTHVSVCCSIKSTSSWRHKYNFTLQRNSKLSTCNVLTTMSVPGPLARCESRTASQGFVRTPALLVLMLFFQCLCCPFSVYYSRIALLSECYYLSSGYILILYMLMCFCQYYCYCLDVFVCMYCYSLYVFF